jgi:hypothetical protein
MGHDKLSSYVKSEVKVKPLLAGHANKIM